MLTKLRLKIATITFQLVAHQSVQSPVELWFAS
jgi:hypothetical protein